jgi:hypothetical protein
VANIEDKSHPAGGKIDVVLHLKKLKTHQGITFDNMTLSYKFAFTGQPMSRNCRKRNEKFYHITLWNKPALARHQWDDFPFFHPMNSHCLTKILQGLFVAGVRRFKQLTLPACFTSRRYYFVMKRRSYLLQLTNHSYEQTLPCYHQ